MQFIKCTREALLKPLQMIGGIVDSHQTLAILSNIYINQTGSKVSFTTTDLEIQIRTSADIGVGNEDVMTTLPAAKLTALLNAITGASTEVSLTNEEKRVVLSAEKARFSLSPMAAAQYPVLPKSEMPNTFTLKCSELKHLLQMVHFAMAQQDIRFYLNGLLLVIGDGFVRSVATDGHRLACFDFAAEISTPEQIEAILPRKTVLQLVKLLPDNDSPVVVHIGKTQASFEFDNIEFLTKLVEGKFPDYGRVIPANNDKTFLVNRDQLIGALKRTAILANEKFKGVRWFISANNLKIQSINSEMEEAVEEINIDYSGESLDLGFNVTYLLDVLSNLKNADVRFAFASSQGATLVTMPESNKFRYVLMPMRI